MAFPLLRATIFPYMAGMYSTNGGGWSGGGGFPAVTNTGVAFTLTPVANDYKPTFNANLTWVKGNHTYKLGATALFEGIQSVNASRADGQFGFAQQQTADPWQNGQPFANTASSGFGYASFFLGATNTVSTAAPADVRLGTHSYGIYVQDSWKITRKLTFDYGLRWDYAILWKEQYGRMQNAAFTLAQHIDRRTAWHGGISGHLQLQLRQRLPVCLRTAPWSRLSDHAEDGVPRGRRHFVCGGVRSSRAEQQRRGFLHDPCRQPMAPPRGSEVWGPLGARQPLTGIRWSTGRISVRSTRFPRHRA